jgi:hypothetical protein
MSSNQAQIAATGLSILYVFLPFVITVIALGIAAERISIVDRLITCNDSVSWERLDLFFSEVHFKFVGNSITIRKTQFGAAMSIACVLSIACAGWVLGINNLMFPSYSTSVSSLSTSWISRGTFGLSVTVSGIGLQSCGTRDFASITSLASTDWTGKQSTTSSKLNSQCVVTWACESCQFRSTISSILQLKLASGVATSASFNWQTPPFGGSIGSQPFVLQGSFAAPLDDFGNQTGMVGVAPTVVSIDLTLNVVNQSSDNTMVAHQPSMSSVVFGSLVDRSSFMMNETLDGVKINFAIVPNQFALLLYEIL